MPSGKPRQTQLSFSPLPESSPAKDNQPTAIRERAAAITISPLHRPRKTAKISDTFLPTPANSSQLDLIMPRHSDRAAASSPLPDRSTFMTRGRKTKSDVVSSPIRKGSERRSLPVVSDSDSDEPLRPAKRSTLASSPIVVSDNDSKDGASDSDDNSDELPKLPTRIAMRKPAHVISDVNNDDDDSDSEGLPKLPRRKTNKARALSSDDDDEDHEEDEQPAKKRRRLQLPNTPRKRSSQEDRDLEDDLKFLAPSSPEPEKPGGVLPSSQVRKNSRQSALDAIKRRRQKNAKRSAPTSSNPQVISDDSTSDQSSEEADEYEDEEAIDEDTAVKYADGDDQDFVVEGGEEDDTAPEIPFEFKLKLMKSKELFKYAVEWMCQKRLNPAFAIDDEVYTGTFNRLDDFVKGMGGSKFQSSAWTSTFLRALKGRPVITEQHFTNDGFQDRCDACNRSGHPPTFEVQFSGSPYDKNTLEEVEDDEDGESWRETELPAEDAVYNLGKHCMANARTAHALAHWRFHLYQWVVDELEERGCLKSQEVVRRDKWSTSKRQEYANGVVDEMEQAGVIKKLYKDFKGQIEMAQNDRQHNRWASSN